MNTKRKRRYFYHDMANYLQVASRMSPEDGNAYLEEMIQKSGIKLKNIKHTDQTEAFGELMKCLDRLQDQKVGSEKPPDRRELAVQYLIESKKQECVRNKIETEFLIQLPADRSVLCSEWVSLLGNLLDNAIEACRYAEGERKIRLITEDGGGFWLLTMENAIGNLIVFENGRKLIPEQLEADLIRIPEVEECLVADVVRKKHVTINVYMKLENGQQEQRVKKSVYDIVLLP